ncbi:MAG: carbon-nitrogen hydrolase family protein [Lentisphaeria bacterium]|nr:carbon-nitrogen hydrolase family protein [Lentisphaeria bacterium]NQZ70539.1 carbon-nitrogen hydrolase family protein [Lentisphaeria bacterium]
MRKLHVAAAQLHSGGGPDDVLKRAEKLIQAAVIQGTEIILFSEAALQGFDYALNAEMLQEISIEKDHAYCQNVSVLASEYGLTILMGFFEKDGDVYYNSQLVARPDSPRELQRKHLLTPTEINAGIIPGPEKRTIFSFNDVQTAIVICADGGIKNLDATMRAQGIAYTFCPTGGGGNIKDMLKQVDLKTDEGRNRYCKNRPKVFKKEAIIKDGRLPFCSSNALGPVGKETCHQGHCMIVDSNLVMRAQIPGTIVLEHMQDQVITAELLFD